MDAECGGLCAAEADFFLDGEGGVEIIGGFATALFEIAEGFDEKENAGTVVERLDVYAVAHADERGKARDEVANGDGFREFLFGESGVDEVIFDLDYLVALFGRHDVDRLATHDAGDVFFAMDEDSLGGEGFRIESADGEEADKAFVINVGDDKPDLVHVRGGHGFFGRGLAFDEGDDVAHVVGSDLVGEVFDFGEDEFADFSFVTRSAGGFANTGEEIDIKFHAGEETGEARRKNQEFRNKKPETRN